MSRFATLPQRQRGATLIVGLIVLMLITAMVIAAFKFSTFNLKAVGNMQARNEAVAAASSAIEQMLGSWTFNTAPQGENHDIDIDRDDVIDYTVVIAAPACLRATPLSTPPDPGSDAIVLESGKMHETGTTTEKVYNVLWDLDAVATDSKSGTRVRVHQGVSRTLTQQQCNLACGPSTGGPCA